MATQPKPGDSRFVTALFRSPDAAERAYRAAMALGYQDEDINVVISDETRDRLLADARHPRVAGQEERRRGVRPGMRETRIGVLRPGQGLDREHADPSAVRGAREPVRHVARHPLLPREDEPDPRLGERLGVDELEEIAKLRPKRRQDQCFQTLREFVDNADGDLGLRHLCTYFAATPEMFDSPDYFRRYDALSTRIEPVGEAINWRNPVVDLDRTPLSDQEFRVLADKLRAIHHVAYAWDSRAAVTDTVLERIVRAECEASGCPQPPEFEYYDQYPLTSNDPEVTARVTSAFQSHFGTDTVFPLGRVTASEDFSHIPDALGTPYTYWGVGCTDREVYRKALELGRVEQDIPVNHSQFFAPVVQPTLSVGTQALVVATLAYLGHEVES